MAIKKVDKYKKLASDTVIFAIGTFSSKLLVYFLMPLYTKVLTTAQYGTVDLLVQAGNLIYPFVTAGIVSSVVRFGLDSAYKKDDVFSIGLRTIAIGLLVFLGICPLVSKIDVIEGYGMYIYLFVLCCCMRAVCSQFVRAKGYVRLYAFDGILSTITTILFNVLFLVVLKMGIEGYILAMVCADFCSAVFLFTVAKLYRFITFKRTTKGVWLEMIKYAVPLIPNTMFWWITNVSDRYLVTAMISASANGLYAVSYKVPTLIMLVSNIFMDAWQLSAVSKMSDRSRERFFSKIFKSYGALMFTAGSGLILLAKLITKIMVQKEFYDSWQFIPFLVMSTVFSCLVTFLGSVYMLEKKSVNSFITTATGAVINIILNIVLIPKFGVNGAAFATFFSYFVVFAMRAIDTRRYLRIKMRVWALVLNTAILLAQTFVMIFEVKGWIAIEIACLVLMIAINLGDMIKRAIIVFREG
ncbi:MAG: polysaccharide biosynthesis C-terminal domain-containing protein [Clostridiales bacterium]|nr:polysaccharide biosynthesis C-terminal domain-containing protein [Clostridiales bacterium]